ncbi:MAG: OmpA family protein [Methylovulum sp.]|uniref:OmpA family protein n=1 Tax=Methylovulum sp. TaxID=1916980 RepID=UPI00261E7BD2|nr:OmpA family protein [Methylovulum sp.]MDD2722764.1 OmpA family protein [Methylovulum sp.]MDD5124572.1 OmpA family protein [Methylovulum sp.]
MKKLHVLALATLTGVGMVSLAQADEVVDNRWYVAPFGSYVRTGGDRGAEDGWGAGMGVGKMLDKHFNVELKGFYQEFDSKPKSQGEWQLAGGTAELQYYFSRGKLAPYTVVGAGGMNTSAHGVDAASFIGEAGAGLSFEVNDNLFLRGDVRYRYNNNFDATFGRNDDEFHDMVVNVGFVVPFGPKPAAPAPFVTPAPVEKAIDCSTMDSDADGVNDCQDKCPATIAGSKVDFEGCPISLELKGVNFKVDSAELTVDAMGILDRVAASLNDYPEKDDIEVRGHTSSEASDAYNLKLSQRRSQSVVNYLKMKGVTNRLSARGFGERQPIADNATEQGRSLNRRVELIWMGK